MKRKSVLDEAGKFGLVACLVGLIAGGIIFKNPSEVAGFALFSLVVGLAIGAFEATIVDDPPSDAHDPR